MAAGPTLFIIFSLRSCTLSDATRFSPHHGSQCPLLWCVVDVEVGTGRVLQLKVWIQAACRRAASDTFPYSSELGFH